MSAAKGASSFPGAASGVADKGRRFASCSGRPMVSTLIGGGAGARPRPWCGRGKGDELRLIAPDEDESLTRRGLACVGQASGNRLGRISASAYNSKTMKRVLFTLALCLLFGSSADVRSQASRVPHTLAGDCYASLPFSEARAVAMRAFDARLSSVPAIMRGIVRNRIESRMHPPRRITIELLDNRIRITNYGRRRVVIDTALGGSTRIRGDDGEERESLSDFETDGSSSISKVRTGVFAGYSPPRRTATRYTPTSPSKTSDSEVTCDGGSTSTGERSGRRTTQESSLSLPSFFFFVLPRARPIPAPRASPMAML